jgi:hypothetical protein
MMDEACADIARLVPVALHSFPVYFGFNVGMFEDARLGPNLTRWMSSRLFEVSPLDPATYAAVSGMLTAAALLASAVPAWRATSIDPVDALRAE